MKDYIKQIINLFNKYKWLLLIVFVLINSIAVLTLVLQTPVFESRFRVIYTTHQSQLDVIRLANQTIPFQIRNIQKNNQLEILKSTELFKRLHEKLKEKKLKKLPESGELQSNLRLNELEGTDIVEVKYYGKGKESTRTIIKTLLGVYIERDRELNRQQLKAIKVVLDDYIKKLEDKLVAMGDDLNYFRKYHSVLANSEEYRRLILSWEKTLQDHEYQTTAAQQRLHKIHLHLNGLINLVPVYKQIDKHPLIYNLLMKKRQALAQKKSKAYLRQVDIQINKSILKIVAQPTSKWYLQYKSYIDFYNDTKKAYEERKTQADSLRAYINRYRNILNSGAPLTWKFDKLDKTSQVNLDVYASLLKKREEIDIQLATDVGNIRVLDYPSISNTPVFPKVKTTLALSLLVSLVFGFGGIIALEVTNPSILLLSQINQIMEIPGLADLSHHAQRGILTSATDESEFSQTIRRLRLKMNSQTSAHKKHAIIGMARFQESLHPLSESVPFNLGISYAFTGQKVLVIEADIKNPSLDHYFSPPLQEPIALSKVNSSQTLPAGLIKKTSIPGFHVLRFEIEATHPSDTWEMPQVKKWIQKVKSQFDKVILLTPPVNLVSSAIVLLDYMDQILFEVPVGYSDLNSFKEFKSYVNKKEIEILGAYLV